MAEIGYKTVQTSGFDVWSNPQQIRDLADQYGLRILCTHYPYEIMKNDKKKTIQDHKILGCDYAGIGSLPAEYISEEGFAAFAEEFDAIAKQLKEEGLGLTYHNHQFEFMKFNGKTGMDIMLEHSDTFLFMLDTYWVQVGGGSVTNWIHKIGNRLETIHFKDLVITDRNVQTMAEVMEGNLDWDGILEACEANQVKYYIVEQDICQRDPFESMQISFSNLSKKGL